MKILLLVPSAGAAFSQVPDRFKELSLGYYPPLGPMYLASYIEKFSTHKPEILDMELEKTTPDDLRNKIMQDDIKTIGIYTTSFTINNVYKIVRSIKEVNKNITIILGGPHIDIYYEETASLPGVDYVVLGEGEIILKELLDCLEKGEEPSTIKGIAYKKDGKINFIGKQPLFENLDELPFPARHLTHYNKYYSIIGKNDVATSIMASRGCPYRCNFCFIQYEGKYRMRSVENIINEIKECITLGITEFLFFDEAFTINKKRVIAFCDEVIRQKLKITFEIRSRINNIDDEMLQKIKQAGCSRIQFGVENASDEILIAMNKKITLTEIIKVINATKKTGIDIFLDFMLGYPGETKEQINKTMKFAQKMNPDYVQFAITVLSPGTKIYEDALKTGFLKTDFWREVAKNPPDKILPPFASDKFKRQEMEQFLRKSYLKFYFRPRYIIKRLFKLISFTEFKRQVKAAYQLLFS
ncbi:MAG: hypothetical protein A2551_04370 [Elusimicrobia bacterium RIFOXYD2_FULL_34_30]|nr:MAG: hypothetical protein A2551_04370 [Elusimicrobia bacterium RIFOXYD2_FULL_34_30]